MERTGLIGPYYRWRERRLAQGQRQPVDDGRPMPPAELVVQVSGPSLQWFSERGRDDARMFRALALRHGVDVAKGADVLDFGCGAGRIARWLAPEVIAAGGRFHGSDLNRRLVGWCDGNLQGDYHRNGLQPPLALAAASLDLVYAHSVLTHLTEATAVAWLAEIARVLRPGGLALMSFHDEAYARRWGPEGVQAALAAAPYVVWNNALEGSNYMSAWTTQDHMAALAAAGFEVVEMIAGRTDEPTQALAVLRARR